VSIRRRRRLLAIAVVLLAATGRARAASPPPPASPSPAEAPQRHLESHRLRSAAVYLGTVTAVTKLGDLDLLTAPAQGRMDATVRILKALRAPAGVAVPDEAIVHFDDRAPAPEGEGFLSLAAGETVLVFADGFAPAYPREVLHGAPAALAAETRGLRDAVTTMDADTLRLHGLTAATRAAQVRLYDDALAALARAGSK
jgi:hypothetical protein